jgi:ATP-dependent DNA helicase RecG
VYPLIEANEQQDVKDAVSMADRLAREVFPAYPVALIHSKVEDEEKRRIMEASAGRHPDPRGYQRGGSGS